MHQEVSRMIQNILECAKMFYNVLEVSMTPTPCKKEIKKNEEDIRQMHVYIRVAKSNSKDNPKE